MPLPVMIFGIIVLGVALYLLVTGLLWPFILFVLGMFGIVSLLEHVGYHQAAMVLGVLGSLIALAILIAVIVYWAPYPWWSPWKKEKGKRR